MKRIILSTLILAVMASLALVPLAGTAFADCSGTSSTAQDQVLNGVGQTGSDCSGSGVNSAISNIMSILTFVVGIAAVVMIIISGFRYITSGGDSAKVSSAKSTLIYAIIGLAIAVLAHYLILLTITQAKGVH
ncbi:MAG: hypothetical protein NVS1B10_04490 [Candidatus Saccharimonadales bacterium]